MNRGPGPPPVPSVCLVILDGWGLAPPGPGNAVELADTPVFDELWATYEHTQLTAWGRAVGLPEGQMGNSEVGHLNLGAGQVVRQDLTRIDDAVEDGSFFENERAAGRVRRGPRGRKAAPARDSCPRGGVHASMDHLRACIDLARREGVPDIVLHAFTDGRDTLPDSGAGYVAEAEAMAARGGRPGGECVGSLLRDGPRQPVGADRPGRRHDGARRGRWPPCRERGGGRARRLRAWGEATSSCCPRSWGRRGAFATATRCCSSTSGPIARAS